MNPGRARPVLNGDLFRYAHARHRLRSRRSRLHPVGEPRTPLQRADDSPAAVRAVPREAARRSERTLRGGGGGRSEPLHPADPLHRGRRGEEGLPRLRRTGRAEVAQGELRPREAHRRLRTPRSPRSEALRRADPRHEGLGRTLPRGEPAARDRAHQARHAVPGDHRRDDRRVRRRRADHAADVEVPAVARPRRAGEGVAAHERAEARRRGPHRRHLRPDARAPHADRPQRRLRQLPRLPAQADAAVRLRALGLRFLPPWGRGGLRAAHAPPRRGACGDPRRRSAAAVGREGRSARP